MRRCRSKAGLARTQPALRHRDAGNYNDPGPARSLSPTNESPGLRVVAGAKPWMDRAVPVLVLARFCGLHLTPASIEGATSRTRRGQCWLLFLSAEPGCAYFPATCALRGELDLTHSRSDTQSTTPSALGQDSLGDIRRSPFRPRQPPAGCQVCGVQSANLRTRRSEMCLKRREVTHVMYKKAWFWLELFFYKYASYFYIDARHLHKHTWAALRTHPLPAWTPPRG